MILSAFQLDAKRGEVMSPRIAPGTVEVARSQLLQRDEADEAVRITARKIRD